MNILYSFSFSFFFFNKHRVDDVQITLHIEIVNSGIRNLIYNRLSPPIVKFCDRKSSCTSSSKNNNIFARIELHRIDEH